MKILPRAYFQGHGLIMIPLHLRSVTIKVGDTISHRNKQIRHQRREIDIVLSFAILYAHFSSKTLHDLPTRNRLLNGHRKSVSKSVCPRRLAQTAPDISGCYGDREVFYLNLGDRFLFINQGEEHEWTIRVASNPLKAIATEERIIFHISAYGKFSSFLNSTQICI
jgi:hypothetical protein